MVEDCDDISVVNKQNLLLLDCTRLVQGLDKTYRKKDLRPSRDKDQQPVYCIAFAHAEVLLESRCG